MSQFRPPVVFAFYSFKGGVGRSMSALNAAWLLATFGRRVLLIDFDLESPGLSFQALESATPTSEIGVASLLKSFQSNPELDFSTELRDAVVPLFEKEELHRQSGGRVSLLSAGRISSDYVKTVASLNWQHGPLSERAEVLAKGLRKWAFDSDLFDYIFIDSRTGWSDASYVTCRYLADHVVVLSALNEQNIRGTAYVLDAIRKWPVPEVGRRDIILVASPVPEWEEEAKECRIAEAEKLLRDDLGEECSFTLRIPYHPALALRESVAVRLWKQSSVSLAYKALAGSICEVNNDTPDAWAEQVWKYVGPAQSQVSPESVVRSLRALEWLPGSPFTELSRLAIIAMTEIGQKLQRSSDSRAISAYDGLRDVARLVHDVPLEANALYFRGDAFKAFGELQKAHADFHESLQLLGQDQVSERQIRLFAIADIHRLTYRLDEAFEEFDQLYQLAKMNDQSDRQLAAEIALGDIARLRNDFYRAEGHFRKAITLASRLGQERLEDIANLNLTFLLSGTNTLKFQQLKELAARLESGSDVTLAIRSKLILSECERVNRRFADALAAAEWAQQRASSLGFRLYEAEANARIALAADFLGIEGTKLKANASETALRYFQSEGILHPAAAQMRRFLESSTS